MAQFRKKPVVIEAVQWEGDISSEEKIINFAEGKAELIWSEQFIIYTLEGAMTAQVGDWIIKGVNGEFYPCKPDIFEKSYDKINE